MAHKIRDHLSATRTKPLTAAETKAVLRIVRRRMREAAAKAKPGMSVAQAATAMSRLLAHRAAARSARLAGRRRDRSAFVAGFGEAFRRHLLAVDRGLSDG